MAEENAPEGAPQDPQGQQPQDPPATGDLGDAGKKALDAERKRASAAERETKALAARLQEFEDRDKSESQKLADRAEAAEKRAADLEARALRLEVASEKGLSPAQAKRLVGTTREELEADADELLETFKPADTPPPSLDLGPRPTGQQVDESPRGLITAGLQSSTKNRP